MAKGSSGRIVIDIDPELKSQIYTVLTANNMTMKDWFLTQTKLLCEEHQQPSLKLVANESVSYNPKPRF